MNQAEDRVTRIGIQGADHGLGLGSSLLRLALQPEETLSFSLFFKTGAGNTFFILRLMSHMWRSIDSRPANEHSPLIEKNCNREEQGLVERKPLFECH